MKGLAQVNANIRKLEPRIIDAAQNGMIATAKTIMISSQRDYVPVDTGTLRKSARMDYTVAGKNFSVWVSYNTDYAIYVHEIPYNHTKGSWKFLELPFTKYIPTIAKNIRKELKAVL